MKYVHTRESFLSLYRELRDFVVTSATYGTPKNFAQKWIHEMLDYNVPKGKLNRGMAVCDVLCSLKHPKVNPLDLHEGKIGCKVGDHNGTSKGSECCRLLQAFLLVEDDIMDGSLTRRGQACWYKQPQVGLIACNDGILLESSLYQILRKYFSEKEYYVHLVDLFHEATSRTTYGQMLDLITTPKEKGDFSRCTIENYMDIAQFKTSYYSFYLPIASGLTLAGVQEKAAYQLAKSVLIPMGQYFQIQDDYLDCYADPEVLGKIGTDIQDKKLSWLLCKALDLCNPSQKAILNEHYGVDHKKSILAVKELYKELNLEQLYLGYEEESYQELKTMIEQQTILPKEVFSKLLDRIYKRKK